MAVVATFVTRCGCPVDGVVIDDRQTVADYLTGWLSTKALTLKPTTMARYTDYITKDLIPALGGIRLESSATSTWPSLPAPSWTLVVAR